jgi:uncharacterized protein YciW
MTKKEQFQKIKSKILKRFPGATTKIDPKGRYYVADELGVDILNSEIISIAKSDRFNKLEEVEEALNKVPLVPHSPTVFDAWHRLELALKSSHIIKVNTERFSDEKIEQKNDLH